MKNRIYLFLSAFVFILSPCVLRAQTGAPVLFNSTWNFHKGEIANGIAGVKAEAQWKTIDLPHDWSIEGPFSEEWASATGYLPGGITMGQLLCLPMLVAGIGLMLYARRQPIYVGLPDPQDQPAEKN